MTIPTFNNLWAIFFYYNLGSLATQTDYLKNNGYELSNDGYGVSPLIKYHSYEESPPYSLPYLHLKHQAKNKMGFSITHIYGDDSQTTGTQVRPFLKQ